MVEVKEHYKNLMWRGHANNRLDLELTEVGSNVLERSNFYEIKEYSFEN